MMTEFGLCLHFAVMYLFKLAKFVSNINFPDLKVLINTQIAQNTV
jgi:hypothetical protein